MKTAAIFLLALTLAGSPVMGGTEAVGQVPSQADGTPVGEHAAEPAPDFGPGPFGFLAFLLWHAYGVFPFREETASTPSAGRRLTLQAASQSCAEAVGPLAW